jgi:hypothetical protein
MEFESENERGEIQVVEQQETCMRQTYGSFNIIIDSTHPL